MNWNAFFGIACLLCFSFPAAVIIFNKYYRHRSLATLLIYYAMLCGYLLLQQLVPGARSIITNYGLLKSYLDIPLMLGSLLFFCPNKRKQNIVHMLTLSFITYEVLITCIHGFSSKALTYILGPGYFLVLVYALYLFIRQVKFTIMHGKNHGRMIMLAAIFFAYACYSLIYYFDFIQKTPDRSDTELLYFLSSIASSCVMAIGLHLMRKRMKELQSLKLTRKELALFFGQ